MAQKASPFETPSPIVLSTFGEEPNCRAFELPGEEQLCDGDPEGVALSRAL